MEFQIFILIWMLFIHKIHTKPSFKISAVTPIIKICYDSPDQQPLWTIQVNLSMTKAELQSYQDPIEIYVNSIYDDDNYICEISFGEIRQGKCRPRPSVITWESDEALCYCASSGNDWYNLKITERSYYHYNDAMLLIKFPFEEYEEKLPVSILATTCFNFWPPNDGVIQKRPLNPGDIWNAYGYLDVAFVDKPGYGSLVHVKIGNLSFCTIHIRQCPPTQLPTGDIICYCSGKDIVPQEQIDRVYLNVTATAQESQSRAILTTEYGPVTGTIGTLPSIIEINTTKSQGTDLSTTIDQSPNKSQVTILPTISEKSTTKIQGTYSSIIKEKSTSTILGTNSSITQKQSTTASQGTKLSIIPEQSTTKSLGTTTEENTTNATSSNVWLKLLLACLAGICISVAFWSFTKLQKKREKELGKCETDYSPTRYGSTKDGSTKDGSAQHSSNSTETLSMGGTSVDPPSYGIHSKLPPASIDSETYQSSESSISIYSRFVGVSKHRGSAV